MTTRFSVNDPVRIAEKKRLIYHLLQAPSSIGIDLQFEIDGELVHINIDRH